MAGIRKRQNQVVSDSTEAHFRGPDRGRIVVCYSKQRAAMPVEGDG
jgi:hypothetical protein